MEVKIVEGHLKAQCEGLRDHRKSVHCQHIIEYYMILYITLILSKCESKI